MVKIGSLLVLIGYAIVVVLLISCHFPKQKILPNKAFAVILCFAVFMAAFGHLAVLYFGD